MALLRRRHVFTASLVFASPLAMCAAASATTTTPTVTSVIASARSALSAQTSVHLALNSGSGSTKDDVVADFGKKVGIEIVTVGKATATIKVTPSYGYIGGNALGLTSVVGLTSAEAKKVGTRWISLKFGTSQYTTVAEGTTIASVAGVLPAVKGTTLSTSTVKGVKYEILTWTTAATSTTEKTTNAIMIRAASPMLPYQETATASSGSGTTTFSKWGEKVSVSAPAASSIITYANVTA